MNCHIKFLLNRSTHIDALLLNGWTILQFLLMDYLDLSWLIRAWSDMTYLLWIDWIRVDLLIHFICSVDSTWTHPDTAYSRSLKWRLFSLSSINAHLVKERTAFFKHKLTHVQAHNLGGVPGGKWGFP